MLSLFHVGAEPLCGFGPVFFGFVGFDCFSHLWLTFSQITPFREVDMTVRNVASMRRFNHLYAKMRVVVENAFRRLKGRWHALRMIYAHPELAASVQEVCVALHNFLEERRGEYNASMEEEGDVGTDTSVAIEGDSSARASGVLKRIAIAKARGLPWVDSA